LIAQLGAQGFDQGGEISGNDMKIPARHELLDELLSR
jgi:hypothetical protein